MNESAEGCGSSHGQQEATQFTTWSDPSTATRLEQELAELQLEQSAIVKQLGDLECAVEALLEQHRTRLEYRTLIGSYLSHKEQLTAAASGAGAAATVADTASVQLNLPSFKPRVAADKSASSVNAKDSVLSTASVDEASVIIQQELCDCSKGTLANNVMTYYSVLDSYQRNLGDILQRQTGLVPLIRKLVETVSPQSQHEQRSNLHKTVAARPALKNQHTSNNSNNGDDIDNIDDNDNDNANVNVNDNANGNSISSVKASEKRKFLGHRPISSVLASATEEVVLSSAADLMLQFRSAMSSCRDLQREIGAVIKQVTQTKLAQLELLESIIFIQKDDSLVLNESDPRFIETIHCYLSLLGSSSVNNAPPEAPSNEDQSNVGTIANGQLDIAKSSGARSHFPLLDLPHVVLERLMKISRTSEVAAMSSCSRMLSIMAYPSIYNSSSNIFQNILTEMCTPGPDPFTAPVRKYSVEELYRRINVLQMYSRRLALTLNCNSSGLILWGPKVVNLVNALFIGFFSIEEFSIVIEYTKAKFPASTLSMNYCDFYAAIMSSLSSANSLAGMTRFKFIFSPSILANLKQLATGMNRMTSLKLLGLYNLPLGGKAAEFFRLFELDPSVYELTLDARQTPSMVDWLRIAERCASKIHTLGYRHRQFTSYEHDMLRQIMRSDWPSTTSLCVYIRHLEIQFDGGKPESQPQKTHIQSLAPFLRVFKLQLSSSSASIIASVTTHIDSLLSSIDFPQLTSLHLIGFSLPGANSKLLSCAATCMPILDEFSQQCSMDRISGSWLADVIMSSPRLYKANIAHLPGTNSAQKALAGSLSSSLLDIIKNACSKIATMRSSPTVKEQRWPKGHLFRVLRFASWPFLEKDKESFVKTASASLTEALGHQVKVEL
ncbi:hypothetical protein GQ42DRAFT_151986 [Ramicandelaber brevisporus]|nr:hypothetical protein GQ42DRAFT_151986 [Ramicandelaber brevisporus]